MSKSRFTFVVAVHGFFIKENKILLLERANTGYMDGYFSVPAGHVDGGELIADAMRREASEEVGVQLSPELHPSHVMHRFVSNKGERIDYFFLIEEWVGELKNLETDKCAQILWFDQDTLPENTIPYIKYALKQLKDKKIFSEFREKSN
jgi:8-oxo-dGTP diphosphatase